MNTDEKHVPTLRLAKNAVIKATNTMRSALKVRVNQHASIVDAEIIAAETLDAAQPEIIAAAVLAFVNRFDSYSRRASAEAHREALCLAVREFGVDPMWVYSPEDYPDDINAHDASYAEAKANAEELAWEAKNPTFGPIPELDEYDTRPEHMLQPKNGAAW